MEKTICQLHRPMTMVCHDFICTFLHHQNVRILPSRTGLGLHKPTTTKSSNSVRSVKLQSLPKLDLFGTFSSYSSYYFIFVTHIFLLFPSSFSSDRCLACLPSFSLILLLYSVGCISLPCLGSRANVGGPTQTELRVDVMEPTCA